MQIRIREHEGSIVQPQLNISTVWNDKTGHGEWVLNDDGFKHDNSLYTAIILCLFTDKRLADETEAPDDSGDRRGWWGHSVQLDNEFEFGSYLWTLKREALTDATILKADDFANEALQPLLDQGLIADLKVTTEADKSQNKLNIKLDAFNAKNGKKIKPKFNIWWKETV